MKKLLIAIALVLFLAMPSWGAETVEIATATWSTPATASALIKTGPGTIYGVIVQTDGANNCTFTLYDNTAASGTAILPSSTVVLAAARLWAVSMDPPRSVINGIYMSVGANCTYQVVYK